MSNDNKTNADVDAEHLNSPADKPGADEDELVYKIVTFGIKLLLAYAALAPILMLLYACCFNQWAHFASPSAFLGALLPRIDLFLVFDLAGSYWVYEIYRQRKPDAGVRDFQPKPGLLAFLKSWIGWTVIICAVALVWILVSGWMPGGASWAGFDYAGSILFAAGSSLVVTLYLRVTALLKKRYKACRHILL